MLKRSSGLVGSDARSPPGHAADEAAGSLPPGLEGRTRGIRCRTLALPFLVVLVLGGVGEPEREELVQRGVDALRQEPVRRATPVTSACALSWPLMRVVGARGLTTSRSEKRGDRGDREFLST